MGLGMAVRRSAVIVLLQLTILVTMCGACSEPVGWQPLPIASRASEDSVDFAILGNVTKTTPPVFVRRFGAPVYGAEVAVECVYKKPSPQLKVYNEVTVVGFGESHDCTSTNVEENQRYIFLLAPFQSGYAVVEANAQLGAERATDDNMQAMQSAYSCQEPSEPTTPPPTTSPLTTQPLITTTVTLLLSTKPQTIVPSTNVEPGVKDSSKNGSQRVHPSYFIAVLAIMATSTFV